MLAINFQVSVFLTGGLMLLAGIIGYLFRSNQIGSLNKKIKSLESEMLLSHAEILQLQKEKIDLLKSMSQPSIPVIPINGAKEDKSEKMPDVANRKQLLQNGPSLKQQSGS